MAGILRIGVALAVLLATCVPRLSISHVHAIGDEPGHHHSHEHSTNIARSADHDHLHEMSLADRHTHVHWLFFEFQELADEGDNGLPANDQPEWQIDFTIAPAVMTVAVDLTFAEFAFAKVDFDRLPYLRNHDANLWAHRPPDAPRLLLCDTARRECSGTLRI